MGNNTRRVRAQVTHGLQINASTTGLHYRGVSEASLTPVSGPVTYSTPGQVISGMSFNNSVFLTADNIVMKDCLFVGGALNMFGVEIQANNIQISGVTVRRAPGASWYICMQADPGMQNTVITRCDLSGGKTQFTNYGDNTRFMYNYAHDTDLTSDPTNHPDNLEWYGGNGGLIQFNNLPMGPIEFDGSINISPYSTYVCHGVNILDNFIDGGQAHILIDDQNTGTGGTGAGVTNVRMLRNLLGGHTNPDTVMSFGIYMPFTNEDGRALVDTVAQQEANPLAVVWPTSGGDVNRWYGCSDLSPDRSGTIATGIQP